MLVQHRMSIAIAWTAGLGSLLLASLAGADAGQANSDTYEEVYLNLDAETEKLGGALYQNHCASCHDGNVVRAPQRYILQQGSPETILTAMTDGPMREIAKGLSLEEKTAIAEYITLRKIDPRDVALAGVACEGPAAVFDPAQPVVFEHWGLEPGGSHFIPSSVASVGAEDLDTLALDWAFAYPAANRARSQPAIGGGALFVGSQSGLVYAFDLETGCTRWQFKAAAEVRNGVTLEPWAAADRNADPLLFFGDLSGNQYALSALTGALQWRKRMDDHGATTLTSTAELSDGVLYVAVSSLEEGAAIAAGYECCTFRGSIAALEADTGRELWRRHFLPEAKKVGKNDAGTLLYGPSGVPIWAGMALDGGRLYIATGDDYSGEGSESSDAIIALDNKSGETVWVRQARFGDVWNGSCEDAERINCPEDSGPDWDYGAGPVLTTDSRGKRVVLAGDKGGVVVALDATDGSVIWKNKVGRGGIVAGINFGLAAHDGKVFVPVSDVPDGRDYDVPAKPGIYALDIDTGDYVWKMPAAQGLCRERPGCYPGYSAAISVTDDYVLAGSNDGFLRAFDIETGAVLWEFDTTGSFTAVDGRIAQGGSIGGGQAPLVVGDRIILNSGYAFAGKMPGNALIVLKRQPNGVVESTSDQAAP